MTLSMVAMFVVATAGAAAESIEEKIRSIKPGRRIEVTLKTGDKAVGKMGTAEPNRFVLQPDKAGEPVRTFAFADVEKVKPKITRGEKWAIWLAVAAGWMAFAASFGG